MGRSAVFVQNARLDSAFHGPAISCPKKIPEQIQTRQASPGACRVFRNIVKTLENRSVFKAGKARQPIKMGCVLPVKKFTAVEKKQMLLFHCGGYRREVI